MKVDWNTGLIAHLGIEFVEVGADRVVARLKVSDKLLTTTGTVHGGTLMALADTIGAAGTVANLAEGQRTATLESKTNFIAGCRSGTLHAEARGHLDLVEAAAVICVDVVEAHGGLAQQHLALARLAHLHLFPAQNFGPACLGEADGMGAHDVLRR